MLIVVPPRCKIIPSSGLLVCFVSSVLLTTLNDKGEIEWGGGGGVLIRWQIWTRGSNSARTPDGKYIWLKEWRMD